MSASEIKKSRRSILLLITVFVIPVILAKLALNQQWFNYGVTNKGQLVEGELTLEKLGLDAKNYQQQWLMLYALPKGCDQHCEKTLVSINNTYVALGKEMPRVTPVMLTEQSLTEPQAAKISNKKWLVQVMPTLAKNTVSSAQIFIVDPLGNIVLSHIPPAAVEQLPAFGKAILADFKKLLKYSRIG